MSENRDSHYDQTRAVLYTAKKSKTRIVITEDAWDKAADIDGLQKGVTHILDQEPIEQVNTGYGIKYEPTLGGWVFHTVGTTRYLFASEQSGNRTPGTLLFDSLKKPDH